MTSKSSSKNLKLLKLKARTIMREKVKVAISLNFKFLKILNDPVKIKKLLKKEGCKDLERYLITTPNHKCWLANKATFEAIQHELSKLNLGEYMKFCRDFNIECNKVKIAETFKKIAINSKELLFEDFKASLWRIFEIRDLDEIDKLNKRLKEIRKISQSKHKPNHELELASQESKERLDINIEKEKFENDEEHQNSRHIKIDNNESLDPDKPQENLSDENQQQKPSGGDPKNMKNLKELQKRKTSDEESKLELSNKISQNEDLNEDLNKDHNKISINNSLILNNRNSSLSLQGVESLKTNNKSAPIDELQQEKDRILKRINELKSKTQEEYHEEILKYIECDNPKVYRYKMKGFMLPFNTRTRYEETNQYKFKIPNNIEEIK